MGRTVRVSVVALAIVLGACGRPSVRSASTAFDPGPAQRSVIVGGPFELAFELPRDTYRAGEAIEGRATLGIIGGTPVAFGSSGSGPFVFEFSEITGRRTVGGVMTADCAPYRIEPGHPMTSPIKKSGGYSSDDPNAAFYREFLRADTPVSLPAGDWRITAVA